MQRRKFIKSSCMFCITVSTGVVIQSLSSCKPLQVYKTSAISNQIKVPLSLFLNTDVQLISADNFSNDIVLRKNSEENFIALVLSCTHADNPLSVSGNNYICHLHGSMFDKSGNVTKGPAEHPLINLNTYIVTDQIIINLN